MTEYVDTHILEANRIHAPEYDDDTNTSLWTNDVSNGLRLDIGDKISVQGAFVSDLGAESATIEFKGDVIQATQSFTTTLVTNAENVTWEGGTNTSNLIDPRYYLESEIIERTETLTDVKDTDGNIVVSYYKTNNGEYMFQMPIFFAPPYNLAQTTKQYTWSLLRNTASYLTGVTLPPSPEHRYAGDYVEFDVANNTAMLIDNSRFAIFGRIYTPKKMLDGFDGAAAITSPLQSRDIFGKYLWKPDGTIPINKYLRIKELLKLQVERGFNTPSEISNVINEQLTKQTTIDYTSRNYTNALTGNSINQRAIGPQNETPTNKLFYCHTSTDLQSAKAEYFYGKADGTAAPVQNQHSFDYMAGFEYIGVKRPEIYETGMEVKEGTANTPPLGMGSWGQNNWWNYQFFYAHPQPPLHFAVYDPAIDEGVIENLNPFFTDWLTENPFHDWNAPATEFKYAIINTNYAWTTENLEKFQKFFKAQARYPELFDMSIDNNRLVYNKAIVPDTEYNGDDITVDTHRYLHLQSRTNEKMPREMIVNPDQVGGAPAVPQFDLNHTSFGYDNIPGFFSLQGAAAGTVNTNGVDFSSVPLFVKYYKEYEDNTPTVVRNPSPGNADYQWDETTGAGLWGGFALRQPASLTVTSVAPVTLEKKYLTPQKYKGLGTAEVPPIPDNISFIAQVPKHADYMEQLGLYTQVGGGPPAIRNIWTMYDLDWYSDYVVGGLLQATARTRCIGFDQHPTAFGNNYIGLYNGVCGPQGVSFDSEWETSIPNGHYADWLNPTSTDLVRTDAPEQVSQWLNKIYCGAIAPQLSFDTTASRFKFTDLHTPEVITPDYDATLTKGAVIPIPENIGKPVYKINKVFDMSNFSPSVTPYFKPFDVHITGTTAKTNFPVPYSNPYCKTGCPFDMNSGVFLEQFKIDINNWKKCFWNIMGFTYEDLNLDDNTGGIQERVTNSQTNNLSMITTNGEVLNDDLEEWGGSAVGVPSYNVTLTHPKIINITATAIGGFTNTSRPAPVTILCQSAGIEATNLPTKTVRPYFTIRTDLIDDSNFQGGKLQFSSLPVIAILQKNQPYADFFYSSDELEFTVTRPKTVTSVTTCITDPSGEKSQLSPNSAVLYKIQKARVQADIVGEVLKANKSPKM